MYQIRVRRWRAAAEEDLYKVMLDHLRNNAGDAEQELELKEMFWNYNDDFPFKRAIARLLKHTRVEPTQTRGKQGGMVLRPALMWVGGRPSGQFVGVASPPRTCQIM